MQTKPLSKLKYWLIFIGIAVFSIVLDQATKILLEEPLSTKSIPIIPNFLSLHWSLNSGSAFGMFKDRNVLFFVFLLIGLPLFVFMMEYSRKRSRWGQLGFSFMFGGAIGNAIDRMALGEGFYDGAVRDFISVKGFAIFNIADSFLVVGTIMACLALLFFDHDSVFVLLKHPETNAPAKAEDTTQQDLETQQQASTQQDFLPSNDDDQQLEVSASTSEQIQAEQDYLPTDDETQDQVSENPPTQQDFLEDN